MSNKTFVWNDHSKLKGCHATLAPSSSSTWLNYDQEKLYSRIVSSYATVIGTALHELAADLITHRINVNTTDKHLLILTLAKAGVPHEFIDVNYVFTNFRNYVNDAIMYNMQAEKVLYGTESCYGTADAIIFFDNFLRIHDLKTGTTPAHMEQLLTYAALFCMEYNKKPGDIGIELRIYQNEDILICNPTPSDILPIIEIIKTDSKLINGWKG